MHTPGTPEYGFERAVEAVIAGDLVTLDQLLLADPTLVTARSTRVTCLDPSVHGATLLHYLSVNGVGRLRDAVRLLPAAGPLQRHCALALAAINRHHEVVQLLIEAGEDPNRYNPSGFHAHQTPLHGAALYGDLAMAQLLMSHGARQDIADRIYGSTALNWARHGEQSATSAYLQALLEEDTA